MIADTASTPFNTVATPQFLPADYYFNYQWHLNNTIYAGIDINVLRIWDEYRGTGVKIGIIDDGFDLGHADLAANFDTANDYDFRRNDPTPAFETGDGHGTAVAGVIGADDNGIAMVGVAPDASLVGMRVSFDSDSTLSMFENAMIAARNVDVVNNSWGFTYGFSDNFLQPYMDRMEQAMYDAARFGRGGLGTNIVFAAGNAAEYNDNVNYHNMQNSPYAIAVGAIDKTGRIASFSTRGAAVLISAPGVEIYTTDNTGNAGYVGGNYVGISGTSFAAPIVTGVIALMLEANPHLGYRDIQEILAYSSKQIDKNFPDWQTNGAVNLNGGGLHYSHAYGFGLIDAHAAVRMAETWLIGAYSDHPAAILTNQMQTYGFSYGTFTIPDGSGYLASTITINNPAYALYLDHAEVTLNISHSNASQLDVYLISPSGTVSQLLYQPAESLPASFVFTSVANSGEYSEGNWHIEIYDRYTGTQGTLNGWSLKLSGDARQDIHVVTDEFSNGITPVNVTEQYILNASAVTSSVMIDEMAATGNIGGRDIRFLGTTIITGDGDDWIRGRTNDNIINTGRGNDTVLFSEGSDTIDGGAGHDIFVFDDFTSMLYGAEYAAGDVLRIFERSPDDEILLSNFEEIRIGENSLTIPEFIAFASLVPDLDIIGTNSFNALYGLGGNDTISAFGGSDYIEAGAGNDTVYGGTGADTIYGQDGADTLYGQTGSDKIYGGESDDLIYGEGDNDKIYGDGGNDELYGGSGRDYLRGGQGDDLLIGDTGNDTLFGDDGNDIIYGGAGDDLIRGGNGNDTMYFGEGHDTVYGTSGNDTFVIETIDAYQDRIYNFSPTYSTVDKIDLSALLIDYDSSDPIQNFINLAISGADTNLRINADGTGSDFVVAARIMNVNLTSPVQNYVDAGVLIVEKPILET